ncbi:MAG: DNA repair protein RecO [Egibacteraceae bacterium]
MALYREQGIVLRTYKLGETDRIVHLLTQGQGKVRAVAKGVRRPGSKLGGRLEPFSHVDLLLHQGRDLDIVSQAELINPFAQVRDDWVRSVCASAMVEAADQLAQPGQRSNPLFLLLLDGLRALAGAPRHPALVLDAYLLRLATVAGYAPSLDACASCGLPGAHPVFSIQAGGALCRTCAPGDARPLDPLARALLGMLAGAGWADLAEADAASRARRIAGTLVHSFLTYHLGRPLRAWDLVPR